MRLEDQLAAARVIKAYVALLQNHRLIPHDRQVYLNRIDAMCRKLRTAAPAFLRGTWRP